MGLFDFFSTPSPEKAAMTTGDQTTPTSGGIFSSITPTQGQALLGLGAGLLSERGAGGLAQGFTNAQQAMLAGQKLKAQQEQNAILNSIRQQNANSTTIGATAKAAKLQQDLVKGQMPKFIQKIGDDAVLVQNSDGTFDTVSSAEMQQAGLRMNNGKLERAQALTQYKFDNQPQTAAEQKLGDDRRANLANVDKNISAVDDALSFGDKNKPGFGSQLAGTSLGRTAANLGSGFSQGAADAANYQQKIRDVLTIDWLDLGQKLKGSLSDKEGAQLKASQPDATAGYETVIKPWLQKYRAWLQKSQQEAQSAIDRERVPGKPSGGGSNAMPGLSDKASKYFQ